MKIGSLKNGGLRLAPKMLIIDGVETWFPSREQYLNAGYKEIIVAEPPQTEPGYHAELSFEETAETIRQIWSIVAGDLPPTDSDKAEAYDILTGVSE